MRRKSSSANIKDLLVSADTKAQPVATENNEGEPKIENWDVKDEDIPNRARAKHDDQSTPITEIHDIDLDKIPVRPRAKQVVGHVESKTTIPVTKQVARTPAKPTVNKLAAKEIIEHKPVEQKALHMREDLALNLETVSKHTLTALRVFPDVPVNEYRVMVFNDINLGPPIKLVTKPNTVSDILPGIDEQQQLLPKIGISDVPIPGKLETYFPLPTLSPNDRITDVTANFEYKLGYSEATNQYYIMPLTTPPNNDFRVGYNLLKGNKQELSNSSITEPELSFFPLLNGCSFKEANGEIVLADGKLEDILKLDIQKRLFILQKFFESFKEKELKDQLDQPSLVALNLMIKEKAGVCLHRSILFFMFAKVLDIPKVNVIANDLHVFIEAYDGESFKTIDLGGGNPKAVIQDIPPSKTIISGTGYDAYILSSVEYDGDKVRINCTIPDDGDWSKTTMRSVRMEKYMEILSETSQSNPQDMKVSGRPGVYFEFTDKEAAYDALMQLHRYETDFKEICSKTTYTDKLKTIADTLGEKLGIVARANPSASM